jgi:L-lactate dehydrogenase
VEIILSRVDVLILTLGKRVPPAGTREDMYRENAAIFRELVIPALKSKFKGIVLVISNPVDLMARLVYLGAELDSSRIMGLGTVVETARLKASLGAYLSPIRPARDVWAHAIGTHDAQFIPVAHPGLAVGDATGEKELKELVRLAKGEVVKAAERVKTESGSSVHPIVEGSIKVIEAIAHDQRTILTVSVLDPDDGDNLFYSMPCCIGREGVAMRNSNQSSGAETAIDACREQLRKTLHDANSK